MWLINYSLQMLNYICVFEDCNYTYFNSTIKTQFELQFLQETVKISSIKLEVYCNNVANEIFKKPIRSDN